MTAIQEPLPGLPGGPAHDNGTGGQHSGPLLSVPMSMPPDARTIKANIFSAQRKRFISEVITFFGEQIEIRQPNLSTMLNSFKGEDSNTKQGVVYVLMNYAFVPGTQIPVFDMADEESIMSLPYGDDFSRVMKAFQKVTGLDVEAETKNSARTPSDSK
jgi:hypothetical protein